MSELKTSAAQRKAADKYIKGLDEIRVRVGKGEREMLKAHAASKGMSLNSYICDLIRQDMEDCTTNGRNIAVLTAPQEKSLGDDITGVLPSVSDDIVENLKLERLLKKHG
jgi:uncharacterized protein (DUF1778 family)